MYTTSSIINRHPQMSNINHNIHHLHLSANHPSIKYIHQIYNIYTTLLYTKIPKYNIRVLEANTDITKYIKMRPSSSLRTHIRSKSGKDGGDNNSNNSSMRQI